MSGQQMEDVNGDPFRGILLKILSVMVFLGMSTCIKLVGTEVATGEIAFFRSFFALLTIFAYLAWRGKVATALKVVNWRGHLARGLLGTLSIMLGFYAVVRLPLSDALALGYAMPLFSVIFAAIFLKETVRIYRISAVAIGLGGVFLISWPRLTLFGQAGVDGQALGVAAAVIGATCGAAAMIVVRFLVKTEKTPTIALYFSLTATVFSLMTAPMGWNAISWQQAVLLIVAGISGGIAQTMLTESYRFAEVSVIAPFEYVSIVFGLIVSYFLFADVPEPMMLVGTAIVIVAGIFIIYRERQLGLERRSMRRHMTPQG